MEYRNHKIDYNEWGYYVATDLEDCDAVMIHNDFLKDLIIEIDEKEDEKLDLLN